MHVTDAVRLIDGDVLLKSPRQSSRLIQDESARLCIGEHGEAYQAEKIAPADHVSVMVCGHSASFPVPPMPGEHLFCRSCESWQQLRFTTGNYVVRCLTCDLPDKEFGPFPADTYSYAGKHKFGSKGGRKNNPHSVEVGRHTLDGVAWRKYKEEDE